MNKSVPKGEVLLEYRVAVLEGVLGWMLKNGVVVKALGYKEMKKIHLHARALVKERYPDIHVEYTAKFAKVVK